MYFQCGILHCGAHKDISENLSPPKVLQTCLPLLFTRLHQHSIAQKINQDQIRSDYKIKQAWKWAAGKQKGLPWVICKWSIVHKTNLLPPPASLISFTSLTWIWHLLFCCPPRSLAKSRDSSLNICLWYVKLNIGTLKSGRRNWFSC